MYCVAAPGINGVISSVTIEALNSGCTVLGIYEGFKQLKQGKSMVTSLEWDDVTRIYNTGGSILRTSKQQLTNAHDIDNCLRVLEHHRVRYLVTIGGTQTAYSASLVAAAAKSTKLQINVVHVPKTIFNDLPLPQDTRCFGHSTARDVGVQLVQNFSNDARTMLRWYILVVMGQRAGHLALGIGKAGASTLTLIPEQFHGRALSFHELVSIIQAAIYKRKAMSKEYGIAVLAEGLIHCLDKQEMLDRFGDEATAHETLGRHIIIELNKRFMKSNVVMTVVSRNLGNELRSAAPNSADIVLTRDLGFAATRYVLDGGNNCMITLKNETAYPIALSDMVDNQSRQHIGSTRIRVVDTASLTYQVALSYMIMLKQADLQDTSFLPKLAKAANMTPNEFIKLFQSVALPPNATPNLNIQPNSFRSASNTDISPHPHVQASSTSPTVDSATLSSQSINRLQTEPQTPIDNGSTGNNNNNSQTVPQHQF